MILCRMPHRYLQLGEEGRFAADSPESLSLIRAEAFNAHGAIETRSSHIRLEEVIVEHGLIDSGGSSLRGESGSAKDCLARGQGEKDSGELHVGVRKLKESCVLK